jgi:ankyrin repeat protein
MISQRVIAAVNLRFWAVVVATILGAYALLVATAAAGPLEDDLFGKINVNDYSGVKSLLEQGANVNARAQGGYTPLSRAVSALNANPKIVQLLIDKGADVNAKADDGSRPLHLAIYSVNSEIVKLLIKSGADVNAQNNDGTTAHFIAKTLAPPEISRILEAAGAKPVNSPAAVAAKKEVNESDEERVSERIAKPAPKAKPAPRRHKAEGGSPPPPELPAGGALSGN